MSGTPNPASHSSPASLAGSAQSRLPGLEGVSSAGLLRSPTPLHPLDRLARHLGLSAGALWVKRDDLIGIGAGGNKARKLDLLVADAQKAGATVLVTGGAVQSNHVRMTGAVAAMAGLDAVGVVGGRRRAVPEGNVVLDHLFGLELVYAEEEYGALDLSAAIEAECDRRQASGWRPYAIPLGGSSPLGALGYATAAAEIDAQLAGSTVYVADGTGGTHAGLVAGFGDHSRVRGVDVGAVPEVARRIAELAVSTSALAGGAPPDGEPVVDPTQVGDGYSRPTDASREALQLVAKLEGLVLDPVYTAKAMAGLLADVASGVLNDGPTVFVHTGGGPGLFTERHAKSLSGVE